MAPLFFNARLEGKRWLASRIVGLRLGFLTAMNLALKRHLFLL